MTNLLEETLHTLNINGKQPEDVLFCQTGEGSFSWEYFLTHSSFNYDNGYGGNEIDLSLMVVGKDFWLERHEYDGSEWWEFKTIPQKEEPIENLTPEILRELF